MIDLFFANTFLTILFIVIFLIDLFAVANGVFVIATIVTALFLGGLYFWHQNPFSWIIANPLKSLYYVLAYLVAGFLYSMFKYRRFLLKRKNEDGEQFQNYKVQYRPAALKGDICGWMFWWPLSLIGFVVTDFLQSIAESVYNLVKGWFETIYNKVTS